MVDKMEGNDNHRKSVPGAYSYAQAPQYQDTQAPYANNASQAGLSVVNMHHRPYPTYGPGYASGDSYYPHANQHAANQHATSQYSTYQSSVNQSSGNKPSGNQSSGNHLPGRPMAGSTGFGGGPGVGQHSAYRGYIGVNQSPASVDALGPMNGHTAPSRYGTSYRGTPQHHPTMGTDYAMNDHQAPNLGMANYEHGYQQPGNPSASYHATMDYGVPNVAHANPATLIAGNSAANHRHQARGVRGASTVGDSVAIQPPMTGAPASGANVNSNNTANTGSLQGTATATAEDDCLKCGEPGCSYKTKVGAKRARENLRDHIRYAHCGTICKFVNCGHRTRNDADLRTHINRTHGASVRRNDEGKWKCLWPGCSSTGHSTKGGAKRCMLYHNRVAVYGEVSRQRRGRNSS